MTTDSVPEAIQGQGSFQLTVDRGGRAIGKSATGLDALFDLEIFLSGRLNGLLDWLLQGGFCRLGDGAGDDSPLRGWGVGSRGARGHFEDKTEAGSGVDEQLA